MKLNIWVVPGKKEEEILILNILFLRLGLEPTTFTVALVPLRHYWPQVIFF